MSSIEKFGTGIIIAFCIVMACMFFARPINKASNMRDITVKVTEKAVKNSSENGKYLVFGEDDNGTIYTFEITDSLFKMRFDSSDVYAAIKIGNKYIFTVGGSRIKILSWYPNIYEYKVVEQSDE